MEQLNYFKITTEQINLEKLLKKTESEFTGGTVIFIGSVRNNSEDKKVDKLTYEADMEFANNIMKKILTTAQDKWGPLKIAVEHRIGKDFTPGTLTLVIITAAAHREEAYESNRYILEKIKEDLPIWKKETFVNGNSKWIGWDN